MGGGPHTRLGTNRGESQVGVSDGDTLFVLETCGTPKAIAGIPLMGKVPATASGSTYHFGPGKVAQRSDPARDGR